MANRGSGDLTVIDSVSETVVATVPLPPAARRPEPMYVVGARARGLVFVGDRANNRVVIFSSRDFAALGEIPAGNGVFHMWADARGDQLWVNNDIDKTATVIGVKKRVVLGTVAMPADLVALGGKPHDVFVEPRGRAAYVSIIGVVGPDDYVVKFDTDTFAETGRAPVGKDPHLSLSKQAGLLFVPCQGGNEVVVFDPESMSELKSIPVPGAHGAGMSRNGAVFYTSNLPGLGIDALFTIDTRSGTMIGAPVNTPFPTPHNIVVTPGGDRLFLTHSGLTSTKVTVYQTDHHDPRPVYLKTLDVGLNPFGITYIHGRNTR